MTESRETRARDLFLDALDLDPEEREGFVAMHCAGDPELQGRVAALLAAHARAESAPWLRSVEARPGAAPVRDPTRIGPFRVLRRLGEGGMGVVYLAAQETPIRREVALKVVKAGMGSDQVLARFASERQALALMNHAHIARILDAGTSEDGRPYFVMEYVAGEPLTDYCDARRLGIEQRLVLLRQVCEAVQHAHQKGVIHRDLKPTNILVGEVDGRPMPKVIDFGIAKAVEQRDGDRSMHTLFGQIVGTPDYMSPEQADFVTADIDTRTDVYSLGVLLYVLLCGRLPFGFSGKGITEIQHTIREVDAPAPSARLAAAPASEAEEFASQRGLRCHELVRSLRGELDWITLRALEKARERRYGSAAELASEIDRYLAKEPVLAGPPSTVYRLRKFARRHRVGVAVAAVSVIGLGAFAVTTALQNRAIRAERDRANQATLQARAEAETARRVTEVLSGLFELARPELARGHEPSMFEMLARGVQRVRAQLGDQPEVKTRLLGTLGTVYRDLGRYEEARALLREAVALSRQHLGPEHPYTLATQDSLAKALTRLGEHREARELLESVVAAAARVFGRDAAETLSFEEDLVARDIQDGQVRCAIDRARDLLEREQRALGPDSAAALSTESLLALAELEDNQVEAAVSRYEQLLPRQRATFGEDHPAVLTTLHNLTRAYIDSDRLERAAEVCATAMRLRSAVFGPEHPETMATVNTEGIILQRLGRFDDAARAFERVIEFWRETRGIEHPAAVSALMNLAAVRGQQKQFEAAEAVAREAVETAPEVWGADHPSTLTARRIHALALCDLRRFDPAIEALAPLLADHRRELGDADPRTLLVADSLAICLLAVGRYRAAEELRAHTADLVATIPDADPAEAATRLVFAALAATADGRPDAALAHLRRAAALDVAVPPFASLPEFAPLRDDPEFASLAARLERR